ncbi:MAG: coproporphyrinogen III oxidase [Clostridium sp.]|nr:coproporphyrinogen III oxidase [Clostridium sp.]
MIKIKINDEKFRYDTYNIFNLFFHEIEFVKDNLADYEISICDNYLKISHTGNVESFNFDAELPKKTNVKKILYVFLSRITGKVLPWGTLVGIRPTKIAIDLLKQGKDEEYIEDYFKNHNLTSKEKIKLCVEIAKREIKFVNSDAKNISVYVGMPFCPTRCLYCSFISDTISNCSDVIDSYLEALYFEMKEMSEYIKRNKLNIECVYFGGGTPTSINEDQFDETMKNIYENFINGNNVKEVTVECGRPDSITYEKLCSLKKYGVERISINPQTMNDKTLKLIGRKHTAEDIISTFKLARSMGFDNINLDVIVGLPGEGIEEVRHTCSEIIKLNPDSVTVHGMSLKRDSNLHKNIIRNIHMKIAEGEELSEMYKICGKLPMQLNLKPYYMYRQKNMVGNMENVGYSKPGQECIYNIQMIEEKQTMIAVGANAVSKIIFLDEDRLERFPNNKDVREYIKNIHKKVSDKIKFLDELYK